MLIHCNDEDDITTQDNIEFRSTMNRLNQSFVRACQDEVSKASDCLLVPLIKNYLVYLQDCLLTLKGDSNIRKSNSFTDIGKFYDDFAVKLPVMSFTSVGPVGQQGMTQSTTQIAMNTVNQLGSQHLINPNASALIGQTASSNCNSKKVILPLSFTFPASLNGNQKANLFSSATFPQNSFEQIPNSANLSHQPETLSGKAMEGYNSTTTIPSLPISSGQPVVNNEESDDDDDGDSEVPPKDEFTPVVESDAVYNIKCKVFYMIDGSYKDKGVGQLYVKKLESGKYQLVVRGENALGSVIMNLLLSKTIPMEKKSPKDIMTVDPQGNKGRPATVLIRVKDESSANELLNKLNEFKHSSP